MADDPNSRKLPRSRFGRLARLAATGARSGANLLLGRNTEDAALAAAKTLGNLRGLATKLGQMASYVDGVIPEQHRDGYERHMKGLLAATTASPPEAISGLLREEFGKPPEELFLTWDPTPIASASIGQVHRATLADGREVAVKVQHPGVAQAVENDLKNAGLVEGAIALVGARKFDSKRMLEEIRTRFREELDYRLEAERQRAFAKVHAGDPTIYIPAVIDSHSNKRVLTTEFVHGRNFDQARQASEELRVAWAEALWRFVYKATIVGGMFNADPHPGNYFFQDNGTVAFIDFGCVQPLTQRRQKLAFDMHLAASTGEEATFYEIAKLVLETRGGAYEKRALAYMRRAFSPQFSSPFRITRPYVTALVHEVRDIAGSTLRDRDDDFVPFPPGVFFMNRLQFGFYSVLARLDVEVDYASVDRGFLVAP